MFQTFLARYKDMKRRRRALESRLVPQLCADSNVISIAEFLKRRPVTAGR